MKNIGEEDADADANADGSCSLSRLPDEIILQILNKLFDLKALCRCYLISKRFSSIVVQVNAIAFTAPLITPPPGFVENNGGILRNLFSVLISEQFLLPVLLSFHDALFPFLSAISFLSKFSGVKSLCIEFPSSPHIVTANRSKLFKWRVKLGNKIESFYFLSPNSVSETDEFHVNGNGDEQEEEEDIDMGLGNKYLWPNLQISVHCQKDANEWYMMLLYLVKNLPMLEKVSITDSGRSGRISLSGEKVTQMKEWVHSASKALISRVEVPIIMRNCYIPALKLPVSGYVMKGVYLLVQKMMRIEGEYDNSDDGFEGKEEAAYTEALTEILEKHKSRMARLIDGEVEVTYGSDSDSDSGSDRSLSKGRFEVHW